MLESILQSTTIPVLEQVVNFAEARHNVLAGNLANIDTPGYQVRDLSVSEFQARLKEAIQSGHRPQYPRSPGETAADPVSTVAEVSTRTADILHHDQSDVSAEQQVAEMVKNQLQHNLALTIMVSQFRLLGAAISERA